VHNIKKFLAVAFICTAVFATGEAFADDADDELGDDIRSGWINNVQPMSWLGLRGLSQTLAAEPLGEKRFNISVSAASFKQEQDLSKYYFDDKDGEYLGKMIQRVGPKSDCVNSWLTTYRLSASVGIDANTDLFVAVPMYMVTTQDGNKSGGFGSFIGGGQYTFPFPEEWVFRLALHGHVTYGFNNHKRYVTYNPIYDIVGSDNEENDKPISYAGYDFAEIRDNGKISLVLMAPVSFVMGNLRRSFKFHVNVGGSLAQYAESPLLLLAGAAEIGPTEYLTIGFEANMRTPISDGINFENPFWFTPTLSYRSPYYSEGLFGWSVVLGIDWNLSKGKDKELSSYQKETVTENITVNDITKAKTTTYYLEDSTSTEIKNVRPLEKFRIFGGFVFSFDFMASKRAEMARQARANAAEKARLKKLAALTAAQRDSVARKAHQDSLELAASLAAKAEKARQDSIAMAEGSAEREAQLRAEAEGREAQLRAHAAANEAQLRAQAEQKRIADSIALADVNKRLKEEKAKRSEAEQMLLSTGMIVLDAVYFQSGRTDISKNSEPYLRVIAKMLAKYPKLKIEIGGHTDNVGNPQSNTILSQKRAEAVFMFMHGVEPSLAQMLSAKGYGPNVPKADNATPAGREANRRVELKVLNPEVLQEYNP